MTGRASRTVLPGVVTVALTLRLLHLHAVARLLLDEPPEVGMDRWLSTHIAEAVARGDWLGGWSADYDSAPGYGYLLGALFRLSDRHWLPPLLLQVALGALACLLVYDLGRRLWSPTAGLLASALLALYGPALFYETLLVKFSLLTVTVAALLVCVVRAAERDRARWMLLGGLALGLLVMLRGNAALVAVPCAWWVVRGRPVWAGLRSVALFVAGAALVLGPLAFRDHLAAARGRGTSLWGIHFYIGTNADADGTYMPVPGVREDVVGHVIDARQLAEEAEGRRLTPAEVSWHWFRRGVAAIRANKLAWAALELHKLRLALSGGEDGSFGDDFGDSVDASWVLRLPLVTFGSIVPLALLGLILSLRRRRALLLPWFVVAYLVSLLPFFITGRYRLPVVVPMIVLAAVALDWCAAELRAERGPALVVAALILAVSLSLLSADVRDRLTFLGVFVLGIGTATLLGQATAAPSLGDVAERAETVEPVVVGHHGPGPQGPGDLPQPGARVPQ
ncbi:MAG: glycosyltransferase family 39 protein [Deltaproteobacteria bacterium]|nr:MAG: glycosyltransferase family 39 protein [Deltaproteobacteria bacterium]